jgi:hypothetical protein
VIEVSVCHYESLSVLRQQVATSDTNRESQLRQKLAEKFLRFSAANVFFISSLNACLFTSTNSLSVKNGACDSLISFTSTLLNIYLALDEFIFKFQNQ